MKKVFIYWDNSNIFYQVGQLARELNGDDHTSPYRVRIHFENLLRLAHADRQVEKAYVAGSIPPETKPLWDNLRNKGVNVSLYDRGSVFDGEQQVPDQVLQLRMMEDYIDNLDNDPGVVVLLSGDRGNYEEGRGFHRTLERAYKMGWGIELLSWEDSCSWVMRQWVDMHGVFVKLDDYYKSITFLTPAEFGAIPKRIATPLDLIARRCVS